MTDRRKDNQPRPELKKDWDDTETLAGQEWKAPAAPQAVAGKVEVPDDDTLGAKLHSTMDAQAWATEFCRLNNASDHGMMLAWLANAIMVGYDFAKREAASPSPVPAPQGQMDERAMFEAWIQGDGGEYDFDPESDGFRRMPNGRYYDQRWQNAWSVWQARAALSAAPAERQEAEELVRYCPGCGSIGEVDARYRDCCPDGDEARRIPRSLAEKCRETFKLAIGKVAAPASAEPVQVPGAELSDLDLLRRAASEAADYLEAAAKKTSKSAVWESCTSIAAELRCALRQREIDSHRAPLAAPSHQDEWKPFIDRTIAVLQRHIVPDGLSDHAALLELYEIFDGPEFHAMGTIPQMDCDMRQAREASLRKQMTVYPAAPSQQAVVGQSIDTPSQITNTLAARHYIDAWHRKHFPTDRTFTRYIIGDTARNELAGDFAWQLAKALEAFDQQLGAVAEAAKREALELAAAACESVQDHYASTQSTRYPELRDDAETGAGACVEAIRALIATPQDEQEQKQ